MNKVRGPLAKKPMGSAKRNQGGKNSWSNKPGASDFTTTAVVAATPHKKRSTRKP